jgi:flagellar assembly factor FliW
MEITTTRFGIVNVNDGSVLRVPGGIIGFSDQQRYVIIEHKPGSPFYWFQALDRPELAFVIIDPLLFKPDYEVHLSAALLGELQVEDPADVSIYVIVTIPQGRPQEMTANLIGPLVISTRARVARQIVLDDEAYSLRHPLMNVAGRA